MRTPGGRERAVERGLARPDLAEPRRRGGVNGVCLRFASGVALRRQRFGRRGDRIRIGTQCLRIGEHHVEIARSAADYDIRIGRLEEIPALPVVHRNTALASQYVGPPDAPFFRYLARMRTPESR